MNRGINHHVSRHLALLQFQTMFLWRIMVQDQSSYPCDNQLPKVQQIQTCVLSFVFSIVL